MTDNCYAVLLTDSQEVQTVKCDPDMEIFDVARNAIGCDWIEIVEPESLADDNLVFLIDEEGKLSTGTKFVNCIASHLYESEKHGDPIIGSAVIVKAGEEDLQLLSEEEAKTICDRMHDLRGKSISSIAEAFGLFPVPKKKNEIRDEIKRGDIVDITRRQPCGAMETER